MSEINFNEAKEYVLKKLEGGILAVLSTCGKDLRVSSRAMCFINKDLTLYFQTDKNFLKTKQIEENPNVAVCLANLQYEGIAHSQGHSSLDKNKWFCENYKEFHRDSYVRYTRLPNQLVFQITPVLITAWRTVEGHSVRNILDINQKIARREIYL